MWFADIPKCEQDMQCTRTCTETLWRFRVTIFSMEIQESNLRFFSTFSYKGHDFREKKIIDDKMCVHFYKLLCKTLDSKKN
jgi:hypothetical protein